jgi:hypothetical protein
MAAAVENSGDSFCEHLRCVISGPSFAATHFSRRTTLEACRRQDSVWTMRSFLNTTRSDPESIWAVLAAVRCMASLTGHSEISLRIALSSEECSQCRGVSETFIEPAGVCTVCWSILVLSEAIPRRGREG